MVNHEVEWKPVVGFEGVYDVSSCGLVRSLDRVVSSPKREAQKIKGRMLRPGLASNGYYTVCLYFERVGRSYPVQHLVAAAFIGPRPDGLVIDHIDGNRVNNRVANLRYVTQAVNIRNIVNYHSKSGALGVYANGKGWNAQIRHNGRTVCLGTFPTVAEASEARKAYEVKVNFRELA